MIAELAAHDEHGGIDRTVGPPRDRRDDEHDLRHPSGHRRRRQLVGDARIAGLAGGDEQADGCQWRELLADDEARLGFEAPVGEAGELVLAECTDVGDGVVDRLVHRRGDGGRVDLVGSDAKLAGA